jgi:hypothetical protein
MKVSGAGANIENEKKNKNRRIFFYPLLLWIRNNKNDFCVFPETQCRRAFPASEIISE